MARFDLVFIFNEGDRIYSDSAIFDRAHNFHEGLLPGKPQGIYIARSYPLNGEEILVRLFKQLHQIQETLTFNDWQRLKKGIL